MDSNSRSMSGANLSVDNGINANGTQKQQSPGVSMTNGPSTSGVSAGAPGTPNAVGTPAPAGGPGGGLGLGGSSGGAAGASGGGGAGK
jgi:hypothetical protein